MTAISTSRRVDINAITGFPVSITEQDDGTFVVRADADNATLQAAIDAAPDAVDPAVLEQNRSAIRSQVIDHLADLRTITGSSGTLTGAQLSNAVRVLARGQIRLIRLTVGLLDGTG